MSLWPPSLTPYGPASRWTSVVVTPVVVVATASVVAGLTLRRGGLMSRGLSLPPVAWIGKLSYSAYLAHPLPLLLIPAHPAGIAYRYTVLLRLASIFVLAAASYYAVERPFLRLKRLF